MPITFKHAARMEINLDSLRMRQEQDIQLHQKKYLLQGIVFIGLGLIAVLSPAVTTLSLELLLGFTLLVSGLCRLVLSFLSRMHWWAVLSSLLLIITGIVILLLPPAGLFALLVIISLFLILEGTVELLLALEFRPARGWGSMLLAGIISLSLAVALWVGFPHMAAIYLGIVTGVNLMLFGISLLLLVRRASREPPQVPLG